LQDALPHTGALRKFANAFKHWNDDDVSAESSQVAVVPHQNAVSASTRFPNSALQLEDTQHASARQDISDNSAANKDSIHLEAKDVLPKLSKAMPCNIGGEDSDTTSQLSSETTMQCLQDAAVSKFRSLVQLSEEIETSIDEFSSTYLDEFAGQTIASSSKTSRPKDSASDTEAISTSQHGSNAVGELMAHNVDATLEVISGLKDMGGEGTSACQSTNAVGKKCQAVDTGLLGESGEALKAVYEALQQVEDVHSSDELMHFELCGPFWELSEV
jgi:hypothetical protein